MKKTIDIMLKVAAAVFLLYVAYGYLTSSSKHTRTITEIKHVSPETVIILLDDNQRYRLDLNDTAYNRGNLLLLYEGKKIWMIKEKGEKYRITPIKQDDMPLLSEQKYRELILSGFTDSDIEYSYEIPAGLKNPNKEKPTYGGTIAYGAPGLSIEKISVGR